MRLSGAWDDAQAYLGLGLHLSFAGMATFTNKSLDPLRDVAARVPLDRILIETDSPYLSPHPHRGQTNEPAQVALIASPAWRKFVVSRSPILPGLPRRMRAAYFDCPKPRRFSLDLLDSTRGIRAIRCNLTLIFRKPSKTHFSPRRLVGGSL